MCFTLSKKLPVLQYSCWVQHTHIPHARTRARAHTLFWVAYWRHLIWPLRSAAAYQHMYEELQYYMNRNHWADLFLIFYLPQPKVEVYFQFELVLTCAVLNGILGCGWLAQKWIYLTPGDYSLRWANYESNVIKFLQIPFALALNGKAQLGISMLH